MRREKDGEGIEEEGRKEGRGRKRGRRKVWVGERTLRITRKKSGNIYKEFSTSLITLKRKDTVSHFTHNKI